MLLAVFVHSLTSEFGFYSSAQSSIFTLPSTKLSEERKKEISSVAEMISVSRKMRSSVFCEAMAGKTASRKAMPGKPGEMAANTPKMAATPPRNGHRHLHHHHLQHARRLLHHVRTLRRARTP